MGDLVVLQYHILIKEMFIETYIKTDAQIPFNIHIVIYLVMPKHVQ